MTSALVLSVCCALCIVLVFVARILRKLYRNCSVEELTPEWLENFSIAYYEPMVELLSDEDFEFLARQPGFDFRLRRKLRRERLLIFREYLRKLISDFHRLHLAIRLMISRSTEDHSDVVSHLMWLKFRFSVSILRVEVSYLLCWLGLRKMYASDLVHYLEQMNAQMRLVSAIQASSLFCSTTRASGVHL